jgi:hypothetical protein
VCNCDFCYILVYGRLKLTLFLFVQEEKEKALLLARSIETLEYVIVFS